MIRALLVALAVLGSGCSLFTREVRVPVEIQVPVPVRALPPPELTTRTRPVAPHWVTPTDPAASSCLTPEGERLLRAIVAEQVARERALEAWAASPEPAR